jgi:Holliday junction resolvase RusA-like endonuclease
MTVLRFDVMGVAEPQGSTRAFALKVPGRTQANGDPLYRAVTTSDNPNLKSWRSLVAGEAQIALRAATATAPYPWFDAALIVEMHFHFARPASLTVKKRPFPTVKPDLDKLARAVLDALTGVLYRDDAQVTGLLVEKAYMVAPGSTPRVVVSVRAADDTPSLAL